MQSKVGPGSPLQSSRQPSQSLPQNLIASSIYTKQQQSLIILELMSDELNRKDHQVAKLERVLSTHSLEGLVFEKRERKQTVNLFASITAQRIIKKPHKYSKSKKQAKIQKRQEKTGKNNPSLTNKKQKVQQKSKRKSQVIEELSEEKTPRKIKPQLFTKNAKNPAKLPKKHSFSKKSNNRNSSQKEENSNQKNKVKNSIKIEGKKEISQSKKKNYENFNKQRKKQKIKSIPSKLQSTKKAEQQEQNFGVPKLEIPKEGNYKNDQKDQQKNKNLLCDNLLQPKAQSKQQRQRINSEQNRENSQQEEDNEEQKSSSTVKNKKKRTRQHILNEENIVQDHFTVGGRRLRERKTKGQAMKKFNVIEEVLSEEDNEQPYHEYSIKKRGTKVQKEYHINRIFRKAQKITMPPVSLDVNIDQICFDEFADKFGTFEMIHFSLSLQFLAKIPRICQCMTNGFIFVWAQKGQIQSAYHILNRFGFDVIDQIMWIKTNQTMSQVALEKIKNGDKEQIFQNCRETCLVGYKCSPNFRTQYCTKISNNIIFAPERPGTYEKPDEIYQIADLMMPGAKKLQIGGKIMGGWLSLKHHQQNLQRCHTCFRRQNLKIIIIEGKMVSQCDNCSFFIKQKSRKSVLDQMNQDQEEQNQKMIDEKQERTIKEQKKQIEEQHKIPSMNISKFQYSSFSINLVCCKCGETTKQVISFTGQEEEYFCRNCLQFSDGKSVIVRGNKKMFLPIMKLKCDFCECNFMYQYYFQSSKGKTVKYSCLSCLKDKQHEIVQIKKSQKSSSQKQGAEGDENEKDVEDEKDEKMKKQPKEPSNKSQKSEQNKSKQNPSQQAESGSDEKESSSKISKAKKKTSNEPEWKLRAIMETPDMKANCFGCKEECSIPYYACEICQNWYWCGKCQPSNKEHHSHSYRKHKLHLII